jgi:hypothetical protein
MAKRVKYSFTGKKQAKGGLEAIWLAGISFAAFLILVLASFACSGRGGTVLGAFGLLAMILSAYGFCLGLRGLDERNVSRRYATIGTIAAGSVSILWLAVFLAGVK